MELNLDDGPSYHSLNDEYITAHAKRYETSASEAKPEKYVKYVNGNPVEVPAAEADQSYHSAKKRLLIAELLTFFYFLGFGVATFGLALFETDIGTGTWPIGKNSMIAMISVYAGAGVFLIGSYFWCLYQFSVVGEEQLDDLGANASAIICMFAVSLSLLGKYFTLNADDSDDDNSLRRLIYVVFTSYFLLSLILIVRSLNRHLAVHRLVVIGQVWQGGSFKVDLTGKAGGLLHNFFYDPGTVRYVFLVFMCIYSGALVAFSIYLLTVGGIAVSHIPTFKTVYLAYFIAIGALIAASWVTWVWWSIISKNIKGSFSAHFDVYYTSHAIMGVGVIFMLIGYRYIYFHVPDDFFDSPPTIVPALKFAYFQKIVMWIFILLPVVVSGIAKGTAICSVMFPIDIHEIKKKFDATFVKA